MAVQVFSHNSVWMIEGSDDTYRPANLLPPDAFLSIAPDSPWRRDDQPVWDSIKTDLFSPEYNDTLLMCVEGDFATVQKIVFDAAKHRAQDHQTARDGGLYALWNTHDGRVVVASMCNGGAGIAQIVCQKLPTQFPLACEHMLRESSLDAEDLFSAAHDVDRIEWRDLFLSVEAARQRSVLRSNINNAGATVNKRM